MTIKKEIFNHRKMTGLALVECTIILPFLLLLMLISIEGGRFLYSHNTLTKLTRDAARFLSDRSFEGSLQTIVLTSAKTSDVKRFVVYGNLLGSGDELLPGLNVSHITVSSSGNHIIVQSDYPYTTAFGETLSNLGASGLPITLHSRVIMRAVN